MNVSILLGPPGAGKGTVSEVLVDQGCKHISTGQLLREEIARGTEVGLEAERLINKGQFVPDEMVVKMVRDLLETADGGERFLFDGFPRTLVQAERLEEMLSDLKGSLGSVIVLECPDQVIVERLSGRRTCGKCGAVYHMKYNPPAKGEYCDVEGCTLEQRTDDTEETVSKRLRIYKELTEPLVKFYTQRDRVQTIDATLSIEEVRSAVAARIG